MRFFCGAAIVVAAVFYSATASSHASIIYWTDSAAGKVQRLDTAVGVVEDLLTPADGLSDPRGIAVDAAKGRLYWAENGTGRIRRSDLDGSDVEDVVSQGLGFPADISIVDGKLYWADRDQNAIRRSNLDGSAIEIVRTGINQPYFFVIDLPGNRIYWSEFDNSMIHRASLDGSGPVEDFITGLGRVRDVALDVDAGWIYWNDRFTHKVQRGRLDGAAGVQDLYTSADGLDRPHGLFLDPTDDYLYWADTTSRKIMRGRTDGTESEVLVGAGLSNPWGIAVISSIPEPAIFPFAALSLLWLRRCRAAYGIAVGFLLQGTRWEESPSEVSSRWRPF